MKKSAIGIAGIALLAIGIGLYLIMAPAATAYGAVSVLPGNLVYGASIPTYSGIENIYIVKTGQTYTENFSGLGTDNVLGTITSSSGSVNIPYNTNFVIVVAVKGHDENMAYVQKENLKVELAISGSFTLAQENSTDAKEYQFATSAGVWIRMNVVWDNNGNYYQLAPGGSITLDPVRLWTWA